MRGRTTRLKVIKGWASWRPVERVKIRGDERKGEKEEQTERKRGKSSSHPVIILQAKGKCSWGGEGARQMAE